MSKPVRHWKKEDLKFLLNPEYFPNCIECGCSFFHKAGCTRGKDLEAKTINERLDRRLAEFIQKHGENGSLIKCKDCSNPATGEMKVFYHGTQTIIESWPVCIDHAFYEDSNGRNCQYEQF